MKHSDVFGSLYIMSPCCMSAGAAAGAEARRARRNMEAPWRSENACRGRKIPGLAHQLAVAAAWSPNPKKPPLYFDMPLGEAQQEVLNKWAANAPLVFVTSTSAI